MTDQPLFSDFPPVSREDWEKIIIRDLKGADYKERLRWRTGEGVEALPFYRQDDMEDIWGGLISEQRSWEIRQPISAGDVAAANAVACEGLQKGADALEIILEPHPQEKMMGGTVIQDQTSFSTLLDGIDLTQTPLHFAPGAAAPALLAMLYNEVNDRSLPAKSVNGSFLHDPFVESMLQGRFASSTDELSQELKQCFMFCSEELPAIKCLGIDARPVHQAGATMVQQLGYAMAVASEYLAILSDAGMEPKFIASAMHFNFATGAEYFLEIAKFRAVRLLWRRLLEAYGVKRDQPMYIHATTSKWNQTMYDPYVNMLRTTTEGMSTALGGCDALTIHPFDAAFRAPDDFSQRIARNVQVILQEEAYFDKVTDPSAGSYYIETLTDKLAKAAWDYFCDIEAMGGLMKAISSGKVQAAIAKARQQRDQDLARRKRVLVGTNQYTDATATAPETEKPQKTSLKYSGSVCIDRDQLFSSLKRLFQAGHSLGDVLEAESRSKGSSVPKIHPYRGAEPFESLRRATEYHSTTPTVLTLPLGDKHMRKVRSAFAVNFLGCAGYDITDSIGYDSVEEAVDAVCQHQPDILVLCSSDDEYPQIVPALCKPLDNLQKRPIILLAGNPNEGDDLKKTCIDGFIHRKSNVLKTLTKIQKQLGVIE